MGTLRLLVTKPVSRTELMLAKYAASVVYYCLIIDMDGIACFILKHAFFGTNDMLIARNDVMEQISRNDILCAISQLLDMRAVR